jgi:LmbE family N-acetylglucosaminyl deacetylase
MNLSAKRALFLSAHADDAEFGAGGVIQKLVAKGVEVTSLVFSICEKAVDTSKYDSRIREKESKEAARILGIQKHMILEYPVRKFPEYRQEILQEIYDMGQSCKYDIVFTHWLNDIHQDHRVIAEESFRAFKGGGSTLFSYEVPLDCQGFSPNVFVPLTEEEVDKKIRAVWSYQSEVERRWYLERDGLKAAMRYRGPFAHTKFAEAFELKIMVLNI